MIENIVDGLKYLEKELKSFPKDSEKYRVCGSVIKRCNSCYYIDNQCYIDSHDINNIIVKSESEFIIKNINRYSLEFNKYEIRLNAYYQFKDNDKKYKIFLMWQEKLFDIKINFDYFFIFNINDKLFNMIKNLSINETILNSISKDILNRYIEFKHIKYFRFSNSNIDTFNNRSIFKMLSETTHANADNQNDSIKYIYNKIQKYINIV